jgi:hypothetical protein
MKLGSTLTSIARVTALYMNTNPETARHYSRQRDVGESAAVSGAAISGGGRCELSVICMVANPSRRHTGSR